MTRMITLFALAIISLLVIPASGQEPQPNFSDLPAGVWTEIDVDTGVCLYGDDYSFFVRPNPTPTNNLVIYFQGGGACWDGLTCGSIGSYATVFDVYSEQINLYTQGIFALGNQANPIQEANIVFVPYCSGDLHMGNSQATFDVPPEAGYSDPEIDVFFNGFNNSGAVLEWVYANFQSPSRLLISGCSAGGYGALHQAPYIMEQYSGVPTTIISDAAIGIQGKNWDGFETWNALSTLPDFIPELANMTTQDYSTTTHMEIVARTYPQTNFAQYSSYLDETQVSFFLSAGGRDLPEDVESTYFTESAPWSEELIENTARLSELPNYRRYIAGGFLHCILNNNFFYAYNEQGVPFALWFNDVLNGGASDVVCNREDGTCFLQPIDF